MLRAVLQFACFVKYLFKFSIFFQPELNMPYFFLEKVKKKLKTFFETNILKLHRHDVLICFQFCFWNLTPLRR